VVALELVTVRNIRSGQTAAGSELQDKKMRSWLFTAFVFMMFLSMGMIVIYNV
jgi:hypothetical protein